MWIFRTFHSHIIPLFFFNRRDSEVEGDNRVRGSEPTFGKSEEGANYIEECFFKEYKPGTQTAPEHTPPTIP